jgi:hypothetical protein
VDLRAVRQGEARVVLLEDGAEQLDRREHLRRRELLVADRQHPVLDEGPVQGVLVHRRHWTAEVDAADLGTGPVRSRSGHDLDFHRASSGICRPILALRSPSCGFPDRRDWMAALSVLVVAQ